jgi:hypothetical protein
MKLNTNSIQTLTLKITTMKKVLAILLVCFAVATAVNAQDKAIGLKLGNGFEISGQMAMGDANRIEANLSFLGGLGLSGYYQWVKDLPALGKDWKWFYGGGADIALGSGYFDLGVGGQAGLEFDLQSVIPSLPLQLTIDATPTINIIGGFSFGVGGGLGIRYRF